MFSPVGNVLRRWSGWDPSIWDIPSGIFDLEPWEGEQGEEEQEQEEEVQTRPKSKTVTAATRSPIKAQRKKTTPPRSTHTLAVPRMDIRRSDTFWVIEAALPGVKFENINLEIEEGQDNQKKLIITGTSRPIKEGYKYVLRELPHRQFRRSVELPITADTSNLKAKFKNGMLHIKIQRHAPEKQPVRKSIPIETNVSGEGSAPPPIAVGVEKRVEQSPQRQSKQQIEITSGQSSSAKV